MYRSTRHAPALLSRAALCLLALASAAGCRGILGGGEEEDDSLCRQTYEFGNYGCALVEGRVVDPRGAPVAGAYVGLWAPEDGDRGGYNFPTLRTGADGRFAMEVQRFTQPPVIPSPDTVTMYLHASVPSGGPADPVYRSDSVAVVLHVMPVGARAVTTHADVTVPVP